MICLLLFPKTSNLSHFLSDWCNLLWQLALVWHVALKALKALFMIDASLSKTRLAGFHWVSFHFVSSVASSHNGWTTTHYAWEWRGSPETGWGGVWFQAMSLADLSKGCIQKHGCDPGCWRLLIATGSSWFLFGYDVGHLFNCACSYTNSFKAKWAVYLRVLLLR